MIGRRYETHYGVRRMAGQTPEQRKAAVERERERIRQHRLAWLERIPKPDPVREMESRNRLAFAHEIQRLQR